MDRGLGFLVVALQFYVALCPAVGQPSHCADVFATTGNEGYRPRRDSDRCEGLFETQVAGGSLELVSLTYGRIDYRFEHEALLIQAPASNLRLRGQGVPIGVPYRLDARLAAQGTIFRLPLESVLRPVHILPTQLGLLGIREAADAGSPVYIPIWTNISQSELGADVPPIAVLRAQESVLDIRWRFNIGTARNPFQPVPDATGLVVAGQRIELELSALRGASGILELKYSDLQGMSHNLTYRLAHQ
jgi:hypothetical protein